MAAPTELAVLPEELGVVAAAVVVVDDPPQEARATALTRTANSRNRVRSQTRDLIPTHPFNDLHTSASDNECRLASQARRYHPFNMAVN